VAMGLGGGIIRDLLLGLRPVAVTNHYYLPTVTVAALAGYLFATLLQRFGTPFAVLDAMATGLFTVVGVEKALLYDLPYVSAIFIGVAAGVGGGLFVDLIAGRPVGIVQRGPWNATAALSGAAFYAVLADLNAPTGFRQAAALAVVVTMRLASLRWGLHTPLPDDLVHKLTPKRHHGDDVPQDTAGTCLTDGTRCGGRAPSRLARAADHDRISGTRPAPRTDGKAELTPPPTLKPYRSAHKYERT
jgi:uncharacterized membrane protein YeiH